MKLVIQRVLSAAVFVGGREVASIAKGLLIFIGAQKGDRAEQAQKLADKVAKLRVFEDAEGKMNLPVGEVTGSVLVVSQFTLAADLTRGNRPSFDPSEIPEKAVGLIKSFVERLLMHGIPVFEGQFGASMQVKLVNDGPVTFILHH